nr:phage baseplate assembly protein V [Flavobacterium hibisci]
MLQPNSGSGKGFYFIPEIGEEVLVSFEVSNAQNPYVLEHSIIETLQAVTLTDRIM